MLALASALRYRGDERQLGRALYAVCQDPMVASAFVIALLDARQSPSGRPKRRLKVPAELICTDEHRLMSARTRAGVRALGRVDLLFTGERFGLMVELKIDANFGAGQIRKYAEAGLRVAALVREPGDAIKKVGDVGPRWMGATARDDLLEPMRRLPISDQPTKELWLALLELGERSGDLARTGATDVGAAAGKQVLEDARDQVHGYLEKRLRPKYSREFAQSLESEEAVAVRSRMATWGLRLDGDTAFRFRLCDADTPAPRLLVDWFPPDTRSAQRALAGGHRRLTSPRHSWRERETKYPSYRFETSLPPSPTAPEAISERVVNGIQKAIDDVLRRGLFDWDARHL
jgi:hypothetical protein